MMPEVSGLCFDVDHATATQLFDPFVNQLQCLVEGLVADFGQFPAPCLFRLGKALEYTIAPRLQAVKVVATATGDKIGNPLGRFFGELYT